MAGAFVTTELSDETGAGPPAAAATAANPAWRGSDRGAAQRIVRGAAQMAGSVYFARLVNWAAYVLLLRRLSPEDFGQIALAVSILMVVTSLKRFGLHVALLHRYDDVERLATTHLLLNGGLAAFGVVAVIGTAFVYAMGGEATIVVTALVIFAILDMVRSLAQTSETQLRQELQFGRLALAHAAATITASIAAVAIAYAGGGSWALILGFSINSATYVVSYCGIIWSRRPPRLPRLRQWDRAGAGDLVRYGVWFWVAGILQTLTLHYDRLIVGMMLSDGPLGIYAAAHLFAQIPTGAVTHMIQGVTGTVYARYQQDRTRLSEAFYRTQRLIVRCTVPITLILALEAPAFVQFVNDDWLPLVPVLRWLILYSLCRPAVDDIYFLLYAVGEPRRITRFVSLQAGLLLVLAPLLTSQIGLEGTAIGMDVAALAGILIAMRAVRAHVDVAWLRVFGPPILAGAVATAMRLGLDDRLAALSREAALVSGAAALGATYAAILILLERRELVRESRILWQALRGAAGAEQGAPSEGRDDQ